MKNKNMQMPVEFVTGVYALMVALEDVELDGNAKDICKRLDGMLKAKMEAMERRNIFTAYKVAPDGSDEREKRRREYLDKAGVHQDWQTEKEIHL